MLSDITMAHIAIRQEQSKAVKVSTKSLGCFGAAACCPETKNPSHFLLPWSAPRRSYFIGFVFLQAIARIDEGTRYPYPYLTCYAIV